MFVSVIIRSKDEADRLRLTLTSLARQSMPAEVIVVNDGSSDHTPQVLAEARTWLKFTVVNHPNAQGRSGAANAGARIAKGQVLLFLDGDTIAGPELVAKHAAAHLSSAQIVGRGETLHFRGPRFFRDPESGAPAPGYEKRLAGLPPGELPRMLVTRGDIMENFAGLELRAQPGIYSGAVPRRLNELEMDALMHHPDCTVLWAAASGHNLSVKRDEFHRVGGFHGQLDINEHRELALRLVQTGGRMVAIAGARSYHLTRAGWRDPLRETAWEKIFYQAQPILAVKLLSVFWASLNPLHMIPPSARIGSLLELEVAARGDSGIDYDAIRRLIPSLPVLASIKS